MRCDNHRAVKRGTSREDLNSTELTTRKFWRWQVSNRALNEAVAYLLSTVPYLNRSVSNGQQNQTVIMNILSYSIRAKQRKKREKERNVLESFIGSWIYTNETSPQDLCTDIRGKSNILFIQYDPSFHQQHMVLRLKRNTPLVLKKVIDSFDCIFSIRAVALRSTRMLNLVDRTGAISNEITT